MRFTKLQGLGNDFVLVDARELGRKDWPKLAEAVCQRRFGVGADGLLLLLDSQVADFRMRVFNPDGSEAEACGNGLRCLVRYIAEQGLSSKDSLLIETIAGVRQARLVRRAGRVERIQAGMGKPEFAPDKIPMSAESGRGSLFDIMLGDYPLEVGGRKLRLSFVSMGNPHAVFFTGSPVSDFPLSRVGPLMQKNKLFPRGVNFEVAHVLNSESIEMRVWERGAGETLACGSGACAVAVAAQLIGLTGQRVEIKLPGGLAEVSWDGRGEVRLTGPAEIVFSGEWPEKT